MTDLALEMRGITKRFPGVIANKDVNFDVKTGEIHALLGENGAGKSTLMNILSGLYQPDEGQVFINGQPVRFTSPRDAINYGIGMVHQHFMLVPTQTVVENMILGQKTPRFLINYHQLATKIKALSEQYGLPLDPWTKIWQLSVGEQQRVEILKMLYQGAKLLIMDEPTAVLTPQEVVDLFKTLREMTQAGHTVIFISHKLEEVLNIADRITVMRRGEVSAVVESHTINKPDLAQLMVGRQVLFRLEKTEAQPGNPALVVENLSCENNRGLPALRSLSMTVRAGEVVGVAGVAGNGQTELAEVITGLRPAESGSVTVQGQNVTNQPPTTTIDQGVAHIPADRNGVGSAPNLSLTDNLMLKAYRKPPIGPGWAVNLSLARTQATELVERFDVKTPSVNTPARLLSGGNLQKLILAREISPQPKVVIAVYPTRGLDVGAIEAVHTMLIEERDRGAAILLISEDLDELLSLSDRLLVIYEGQIVGELPPNDEHIETIGLMMAGSQEATDAAKN